MSEFKNNALEQKLEALKDNLKSEAEKSVFQVFPQKTLEIEALIKGDKFSLKNLTAIAAVDLNIPLPEEIVNGSSSDCGGPPKKRSRPSEKDELAGTSIVGFTCGVVPSNPILLDLISLVKPLLREAVEYGNSVRMWILFMIPRIEDGNNFGVSIQEETLAEVRSVEGEAASFMDHISRYMLSRGRLITRLAKYPHVEDYRHAIRDMDEKEFVNLRLVLIELRNHYSTMHDMISKNIDKLKKPRNSNAEHLY